MIQNKQKKAEQQQHKKIRALEGANYLLTKTPGYFGWKANGTASLILVSIYDKRPYPPYPHPHPHPPSRL